MHFFIGLLFVSFTRLKTPRKQWPSYLFNFFVGFTTVSRTMLRTQETLEKYLLKESLDSIDPGWEGMIFFLEQSPFPAPPTCRLLKDGPLT